ncbi:Protein S-acyltransferase 8 [Linum perenne]
MNISNGCNPYLHCISIRSRVQYTSRFHHEPLIRTQDRIFRIFSVQIFLFNGRIILGPDARSVLITFLLIVVPVIIFSTCVATKLVEELPRESSSLRHAIPVLVLLLLTAGRDPGIVPRSNHPPEDDSFHNSIRMEGSERQTPTPRLPRMKEVFVNGVPVKVKYCETCLLYRPPRCSHCSVCDNCVERFDHHCPWVGQCIGVRNYRYFFLFVSSSALLCIYVLAMSAWNMTFIINRHDVLWKAIKESPASVVLIIYCFVFLWFVGGLTCFHLYLISRNQTTYENFRYGAVNRVNVYDRGCLRNFLEVFCTRTKPSRSDFRAYVQEDQPQHQQQHQLPAMHRDNSVDGDRRAKVEDNSEIDKDFMKISERHIAIEEGI